jgi:uncharacterized protein (DUF302 family)
VQRYGYGRTFERPFPDTLERLRGALRREGFAILYEIDLRQKLREKLGVEFRDYVVLGACSPLLTHRSLLEDIDVGLLLPSNVVVYAEADGRSTAKAVDAAQTLSITGTSALEPPAAEMSERLRKVIDEL